MLRIHPVILEWIGSLPLASIARHDSNLASQLRRSATSVYLSTAEGMGATAGRKRNSYRIALGEVREAVAAMELAVLFGYASPLNEAELDRQSRIIGTLVRLAR